MEASSTTIRLASPGHPQELFNVSEASSFIFRMLEKKTLTVAVL